MAIAKKKSIYMPEIKRALLIYNPGSGDGKFGLQLDTVLRMYHKDGYLADVFRLDGNIPLEVVLDDVKGKYEHIVIAGGDGSVNYLINEMMQRDIDLPIGILPMGTANDFALYIGMSQNIQESMRQILTLPIQYMDIGKVNDQYFVNVLSIGFFTDVSQKTDTELKNTIGKLAYYLKSLELLREVRKINIKIESPDLTYDGEIYLLMVFNGVSAGGHRVAYKSIGNDGKLDLILVKSNLNTLVPTLVKFMMGEDLSEGDQSSILYVQTPYIKITCSDSVPTDVDGEKGPDFPMEITCLNKKLKVLGVKASI